MKLARTLAGSSAAALVAALACSAQAGASTPFPSPPATAATSPCSPFALPVPAGWGAELMDVNDSGIYIGSAFEPDGTAHAAFWTHAGADPTAGFTLHLPDFPEAVGAELLDVNSSGVASGVNYNDGRGYVYDTVTGAFHLLPDVGAGDSQDWARRINDRGVVAGGSWSADGTEFATTWAPPYTTATRVHVPQENQAYTWTDPSTGQVYNWTGGSEATGINNDGTVAVSYMQLKNLHPRRVSGNGRFAHDLGDSTPFDGMNTVSPPITMTASGRVTQLNTTGDQGYTFALTDDGLVVGDDITAWDPFTTRPVYWKGGMEHDLGMPANAQGGRALNVNGTWATGGLDYPDGSSRAYVWTGAGSLQLGAPMPGYTSSWAHLVNQRLGQFGGSSSGAGMPESATVWQCPSGFSTR